MTRNETERQNRSEAFLKQLVNSGSVTSNQADVAKTHFILAEELRLMGFTIMWIKDSTGKTADLLVAEKRAPHQTPDNYITCVSHIDTVIGPNEAGGYRREQKSNGDRAYGAGIIDNKGGLAVLIESLKLFFNEHPNPEMGFRVISSPNEEAGSGAWHSMFQEFGKKSRAALGFEPALDDGSIISSRRGNRWYNIEFRGAAAHAGRCQGEEINAAFECARMTVRMLKVRDELRSQFQATPGLGPSLQIGQLMGGRDRHNVVCGDVHMKLDTRFSSFDERDALEKRITEILSSPEEMNNAGTRTKISFEIVDDCPPFSNSDSGASGIVDDLCKKIATAEKVKSVSAVKAGGAGDVNHMSRPGLLVMDGLGPIGGRMHTTEEFLQFSSLQTRSEALAKWYPSLIRFLRTTCGN